MRREAWLIALALVVAGLVFAVTPERAAGGAALASPFARPAQGAPASVAEPSVFRQFTAYVSGQQRALYRRLAGSLRAVKTEHSALAVASLIFLSFLYGIFHAAGPGHGKAVISAYLLASERAVRRGIGLSFAASLAQAATAIVLVSSVLFVLKEFGITTKQTLGPLALVSAGLITAMGAWMLVSSVRRLIGRVRTTGAHGPEHASCGHNHHVHAAPSGELRTWTKAGAIVAAVGLRPCSGAVFVLLFANTIGLYAAGVWSTLAMALGTAITVSALAIFTLWSKRAAVRLAGFRAGWIDWAYAILGVGGGVAVLGLGVLLLLAATGPQSPFPGAA